MACTLPPPVTPEHETLIDLHADAVGLLIRLVQEGSSPELLSAVLEFLEAKENVALGLLPLAIRHPS